MTLTKSDRTRLVEEMKEVFVTKEELGQAIADLVKQLPSKEEMVADKLELLAAINKKAEDDAAHSQLHHDLGEDVPKLQRQLKHLYGVLDIPQPAL